MDSVWSLDSGDYCEPPRVGPGVISDSPPLLPPDPTAHLAAVVEQRKRAADIVGSMSSGVSKTLVRWELLCGLLGCVGC